MRADLGDAEEMLDAQAKRAYRARLRDLQSELDEAEAFNDPVRAAAAREEYDLLTTELSRAVGLGGRDRRAASHVERARINVTRAIRAAMRNIKRVNPGARAAPRRHYPDRAVLLLQPRSSRTYPLVH